MFILNPYPTKKEIMPYNRERAVGYAQKWALKRNPKYYDFSESGGDCTNFASQVLYEGTRVMNYKSNGWYYININQRSPSWTSVDAFFDFLIRNKIKGPVGEQVDVKDVLPGDFVQLSFKHKNDFNHSPAIIKVGSIPDISNIEIAAHSIDRINYPLSNYKWEYIRFIRIKGVIAQ